MFDLNYYNQELQGSDAKLQDSPDEDLLASEEQQQTYNPFQSLGPNEKQSRQSEEGQHALKGLYSGIVTQEYPVTNDGIHTEGHQNSESNYSQGLGESFSLTQIAVPGSQRKERLKGSIEPSPNR